MAAVDVVIPVPDGALRSGDLSDAAGVVVGPGGGAGGVGHRALAVRAVVAIGDVRGAGVVGDLPRAAVGVVLELDDLAERVGDLGLLAQDVVVRGPGPSQGREAHGFGEGVAQRVIGERGLVAFGIGDRENVTRGLEGYQSVLFDQGLHPTPRPWCNTVAIPGQAGKFYPARECRSSPALVRQKQSTALPSGSAFDGQRWQRSGTALVVGVGTDRFCLFDRSLTGSGFAPEDSQRVGITCTFFIQRLRRFSKH